MPPAVEPDAADVRSPPESPPPPPPPPLPPTPPTPPMLPPPPATVPALVPRVMRQEETDWGRPLPKRGQDRDELLQRGVQPARREGGLRRKGEGFPDWPRGAGSSWRIELELGGIMPIAMPMPMPRCFAFISREGSARSGGFRGGGENLRAAAAPAAITAVPPPPAAAATTGGGVAAVDPTGDAADAPAAAAAAAAVAAAVAAVGLAPADTSSDAAPDGP